jgi:hypothetical protein
MNVRSTVTALSTAFALTLMLATASTPAFAAKTNYTGDTKPPATVEPTDKKPKFEQAGPSSVVDAVNTGPKFEVARPGSVIDAINTNPQPTFRPDVRVNYLDFSWNGSGKRYYFRVENIGIETADNIGLSSVVFQVSPGGSENTAKKEYGQFAPIGSLATGQHQDITVECAPQAGYDCVSASLSASVENDLNPANNGAGSN